MKRKIIWLLCLVSLILSAVTPTAAVTFTGERGWNVAFTTDEKMVSSFKTADLDDVILGMQPGDDAIITLRLENQHGTNTNWYMTNKVLDSLEDGSLTAKGGAYTYTLIYTRPNGENILLFDSDTVGGDDISEAGEGLNEATSALKDFFYLDTLAKGDTGYISLRVALDGETQGNDYQDTLADLQMNFAVELTTVEPAAPGKHPGFYAPPGTASFVQTGDNTNLVPFIIAASVSGTLLLVFAVCSLRSRKKQAKEGAR